MADENKIRQASDRAVGDLLQQTDRLRDYLAGEGSYPVDQLELFMETLKESIVALSLADLEKSEESMRQLSAISSSELFRGIGEVTRSLHESIKDIQKFVDPILAIFADQNVDGLASRLEYASTMVKDASDKTLDLLFGRQDVLMQDQQVFDEIEGMMAAGDCDGASEKLALLRGHNQDLINEMTRISELQIHADLVDQIVKKVSRVVDDIEKKLIDLLKRFSRDMQSLPEELPEGEVLHGPVVPGQTDAKAASSQDDVDDLLSSPGFISDLFAALLIALTYQ